MSESQSAAKQYASGVHYQYLKGLEVSLRQLIRCVYSEAHGEEWESKVSALWDSRNPQRAQWGRDKREEATDPNVTVLDFMYLRDLVHFIFTWDWGRFQEYFEFQRQEKREWQKKLETICDLRNDVFHMRKLLDAKLKILEGYCEEFFDLIQSNRRLDIDPQEILDALPVTHRQLTPEQMGRATAPAVLTLVTGFGGYFWLRQFMKGMLAFVVLALVHYLGRFAGNVVFKTFSSPFGSNAGPVLLAIRFGRFVAMALIAGFFAWDTYRLALKKRFTGEALSAWEWAFFEHTPSLERFFAKQKPRMVLLLLFILLLMFAGIGTIGGCREAKQQERDFHGSMDDMMKDLKEATDEIRNSLPQPESN